MTEEQRRVPLRHRENLLSAVSAGVFLVLIGVFFIITPNLFKDTVAFFQDFDIVKVPNVQSLNVMFPAPKTPSAHSIVYLAAQRFSFAWGIFLIAALAIRLALHTPMNKKIENVSDIIFWLVAGYLISMYLNEGTTHVMWFSFWAMIITLAGVTLIVRAIFLAAFRPRFRVYR